MGGFQTTRGAVGAPFLIALTACLAAPPSGSWTSSSGVVRAACDDEARAVGDLLDELRPRLLEALPDARRDPVEVWMQDDPHLYHFPGEAASDAEGLYAPAQHRILLSRGLEDTERVLAHEMVHAMLGPSWKTLPGTLEEGLCDAIAARVSTVGVARLRAGRLSSAALVCGGLQLEVEVTAPTDVDGERRGWSSRVSLSSDEVVEEPQRDVFRVAAGLSSTRLGPSVKRGFYGLSFLLVDRVLERSGVEGLHRLCIRAADEGHDRIPRPWLLQAAELEDDARAWGRAASAGLGEQELRELARLYPEIVADATLARLDRDGESRGLPAGLRIVISAVGGEAEVRVDDLVEVRGALLERLATR